ncbi:unnamed protein product [Discosporangium mesarthrocarpum]
MAVKSRKHKRWVKPVLSDKQKRDRVGFALSHMHRKGGTGLVVDDIYDWVHVDEKWFYVMTGEESTCAEQAIHHQGDFLAAVARPRMISDEVWFDGKIRIWPIADTVAAMCSSKNPKKGPMMLQPATINAERYKELMIDKVIPAIKVRMPRPPGHTIFVQQVGAKPHTGGGGWRQPANLPDLNVNDLGFFYSIQQLKEDVGLSSPEDLVEATMEALDVYPWETLEQIWHGLFAVFVEVLASKGDNSYKLPHLGKEKLGRAGKISVHGRV